MTGLLARLAAAGLACLAAGCSTVPAAPAPAAGRGPGSPAAFCPAGTPPALAARLTRALPVSLHGEIVPLGITASGATAYVSAWTRGFAGVAALSLRTGALRPISRFPSPAADQADGAWGGRWLVWAQTTSLATLDSFSIMAWDSVTGRVRRIGRSMSGPGGAAWPSPWHAPAVSGRFAAWAQGAGPGGRVQIRLADLSSGRVLVIAAGHLQAPFFDGGLLVWPGSDRPGAVTGLHAYAVAARRAAALPAVLREVRGTDEVVTDGTRTAYLGPGMRTLFYSPAQDRAAHAVLRLAPGASFSQLGMARGAIAWTTTRATYLASTRTGGYVQVTPAFGFAVTGAGPDVLVSDAPAAKARHPALAMHVADAGGIGARRCQVPQSGHRPNNSTV